MQSSKYSESFKSWNFIPMGFTDMEGARSVARRLLDTQDRDKDGFIDKVEVIPMMVDIYKAFNKTFNPSRGDIEAYYKILDSNGDGIVNLSDLEQLCQRYLLPMEKKETTVKITWGSDVENRLETARKLFRQGDKYGGLYSESDAIDLFVDVVKYLNLQDTFPNKEAVSNFFFNFNTRTDGKVGIKEFEIIVLKGLKKAGFKVIE